MEPLGSPFTCAELLIQAPEPLSLVGLSVLQPVTSVLSGLMCGPSSSASTLCLYEFMTSSASGLLIRRLTPSDPQRLQQLLHNTQLGDRTPSQLLCHMRQLLHTDGATTTNADSILLRELFLQRLPVNVRMILASAADKRLSELAELADSLLAVAPPSVAALQPDIAGRAPTTALHDIREQISRLADTVAAMQARSTPKERQRTSVPPDSGTQDGRSSSRKTSNASNDDTAASDRSLTPRQRGRRLAPNSVASNLPRLPNDALKRIVCPRGGLLLSKITNFQLFEAVGTAANFPRPEFAAKTSFK
ncbi:hypothetical protein HPB50_019387 [Hyalomma asiaticum]|uniref:Uncharacterized protein n=1 Tax=Hyalomma asiaticum TaxID=266040 RepID=A0ACB7RPJ1_HYAAI|nr:hypothetical protein HPB50_019387 [Hyalomma asiaticum]